MSRANSGHLTPVSGLDPWLLLRLRAQRSPHAPFLRWLSRDAAPLTVSYGQFEHECRRLAGGLLERGLRPGERVLIHLDNSPEFLQAWFACAAVGAVAVTTNTASTAEEMRYFLDASEPVGLVTSARLLPAVAQALDRVRWHATDPDAFARLASNEARPLDRPALAPRAPMSVQFTSGTTGLPKGVVWTQANAVWAARTGATNQRLGPSDRYYTYLPLFHTNAISYSVLSTVWAGGCVVLAPKWSTSRYAEEIVSEGCTWTSLITLSAVAIAEGGLPRGHSLRHAGAICDHPRFLELGVKTVGWWGMTETVTQVVVGDVDLPDEPRSLGRCAPGYALRVVDEDGEDVPAGAPGELLVHGDCGLSLFGGYLNEPEATEQAFTADGWLRTGDQVLASGGGHLTLLGRIKDVLRVGAENVTPAEVERVLLEVPAIAEAAVVGRPDAALEEVPVAYVTVRAGRSFSRDVAIAHCRDRLSRFKVPVDILVLDELPKVALDKIDRKRLRSLAAVDMRP